MGNVCVSRSRGSGLSRATSEGNLVANPTYSTEAQNQLVLAGDGRTSIVLGAEDNVELGKGPKSKFSVEAGSTSTSSTRPHIVLLPHQHTLFCERKQRVCTAVGKSQEMEVLKIQNIPTKHTKSYWFRTSNNGKGGDLKHEVIPGSEYKTEYKLQQEDVGRFIGFGFETIDKGPQFAENIVGPILPGPPRLLEFRIEGDVKEGGHAKAEATYIGGYEGASEYWWMRIYPTGQRTQVTQPTPVPTDKKATANDPRFYKLTKEDIGCTLKAKCRPKRTDGVQGEIFTSKSSGVISTLSEVKNVLNYYL